MIMLERHVSLVQEDMQQDTAEARGEAIAAHAVNRNSKERNSTSQPQTTILSQPMRSSTNRTSSKRLLLQVILSELLWKEQRRTAYMNWREQTATGKEVKVAFPLREWHTTKAHPFSTTYPVKARTEPKREVTSLVAGSFVVRNARRTWKPSAKDR